MELKVIIGLICTLLGSLIGYLGFKRNSDNDLKQNVKEDVSKKIELDTKINVLLTNNAEIKGDIKSLDNKFDKFKDDFSERLTRVEESAKQAHKRIDTIEVKK